MQGKYSIDTVVSQTGDQFRGHGGYMGRSILDQVKANLVPLALAGNGLAWIMFGTALKQDAAVHAHDDGFGDVEHDFRRTCRKQGRPNVPPKTYPSARRDGPL